MSDTMTPRERVRKALNHQEADRVPIDNGGYHNGMHEVAYANLLKHLGLQDEIRIYDNMQRLARTSEEVRSLLRADIRYIFAKGPSRWKLEEAADGSWVDEWGVKRTPVGYYCETVDSPLANATLADLKHYEAPDPQDPARFDGLRERARRLYETTDFALAGANAGSLFYMASELRGYERYMEDLAWNQEFAAALADLFLDWYVRFFDSYLDHVGEYLDMMWIGDDWGTQNGPIMNPTTFRRVFKPRFKELVDFMKSKSRAKVALHCCGSIYWCLQDLVDVGIDVLHPMQGAAKDMDPERIKREFGDKLVFYSGINNQHILPRGTPEQVRDEVRRKIAGYAPGGGYIFSCGHNIQADVPPENILAAFNTAHAFGRYPIASAEDAMASTSTGQRGSS